MSIEMTIDNRDFFGNSAHEIGTADVTIFKDDEELDTYDIELTRRSSTEELLEAVLSGATDSIIDALREAIENEEDITLDGDEIESEMILSILADKEPSNAVSVSPRLGF